MRALLNSLGVSTWASITIVVAVAVFSLAARLTAIKQASTDAPVEVQFR
jgi:hypothetical protein